MRRNSDTTLRACERRFEATGDPADLDALLREVERSGSVEYVSDSLFRFTYEWGMRIDDLAWHAYARRHGLTVEPKVSWPHRSYPQDDPFWVVGKRGYDLAMAAWHARERSPAYAAELELQVPSMFELPRTLRRFHERLSVGDLERAKLVRQAVLQTLHDIRSFDPGPAFEWHPLRDPETRRRLLQEARDTLAAMENELARHEVVGNPTYYHGTREEHLEGIRERGLATPFLASDEDQARCWGRSYSSDWPDHKDVRVLEVELLDEELDDVVPDYNLMDPRDREKILGVKADEYFDVRSELHRRRWLKNRARKHGIDSVPDRECGGEASIYLGTVPPERIKVVGEDLEGNPSRNAVLRLRGGEPLRCPWCLDALDPQGGDAFACPSCWAPQHATCAEEHGRCAVCRRPISVEAEEELEERREREAGYGRAIKRPSSGKLAKIQAPPEELERERLLEESQEELERYEEPRGHHASGRLHGSAAERRGRVPTSQPPKQKLPPRKRGRRPYPRYVEEVRKGRRYRIPVCVACGPVVRLERAGSRILLCPKCQTVHVEPGN